MFGNERQLPGKIHLSAGAEDNRRLRDGLTDGSIDPVTSSLGGSGIMGRGGTGDRQESATNLGFKVSLSASFFVQSNTNLVIGLSAKSNNYMRAHLPGGTICRLRVFPQVSFPVVSYSVVSVLGNDTKGRLPV